MALQEPNVPYKHVFSSEICPKARRVIMEKFSPQMLFGDVHARRLKNIPRIDLYVAGFPCQLFSSVRRVSSIPVDMTDALKPFFACEQAIRKLKPRIFVLENVWSLTFKPHEHIYNEIRKRLGFLPGYSVHFLDLDAKNYGSLQSRRRIFMVGLRRRDAVKVNLPPPQIQQHNSIKDILQKNVKRYQLSVLIKNK